MEEIEFLGHTVTSEGISVNANKVKALNKMPIPNDGAGVRSFLGMAGYYRKFLCNFAKRTVNLKQLTKQNVLFEWTEECQKRI